jgi:glycosyltransferase A (GT-A) superfamily protein (DUF2064 family)
MSTRVLVTAKAPVVGQAKTRLGAEIGMEAAADLAAAALIDTLEVCRDAFDVRYLALAGDLAAACRSEAIIEALSGWIVFEQRGVTFGDRLAHAHGWVAACGPGGIVQVGMDTPQLTTSLLHQVSAGLDDGADVVLGPAADGGWWALGLADGRHAGGLIEVPMSVPETYAATVRALTFDESNLVVVDELRDVDTLQDASRVAHQAPTTRFAQAWNAWTAVAS